MNDTTATLPDPLQGQAFLGLEKLKHASATGEKAASVLLRHDVLGAFGGAVAELAQLSMPEMLAFLIGKGLSPSAGKMD
ncbi:hypothetical protein [Thalassospira lucentensis]|uniref:hypothetical protein n=1 Tax=Thalassospira lucentensis TaxID=168935 RepID=UPI003AA95099